MTKTPTPTQAQRLSGAFVEVNTCTGYLLEVLDSLQGSEPIEGWRLEAIAAHMELMVRRIGYVNQVASNLSCPGLLDVPDWSNWMAEPGTCDYAPAVLPAAEIN